MNNENEKKPEAIEGNSAEQTLSASVGKSDAETESSSESADESSKAADNPGEAGDAANGEAAPEQKQEA